MGGGVTVEVTADMAVVAVDMAVVVIKHPMITLLLKFTSWSQLCLHVLLSSNFILIMVVGGYSLSLSLKPKERSSLLSLFFSWNEIFLMPGYHLLETLDL